MNSDMPQPVKKDVSVRIQKDAIEQRPALAQHIGNIVGLWAYLEVQKAQLLACLLKIEARLATAIYLEIESDSGKRAVLTAAIRETAPDLLDEFKALDKAIAGTAQERNNVIHGLWGLSNKNDNTLVWEDPKKMVMLLAAVATEVELRVASQPPRATKEEMEIALKATREYKEQDFVNIENRIKARIEELRLFALKVTRRSRGL